MPSLWRRLDSAAPSLVRLLRRVLRYGLVGLAVSITYSLAVVLAVARLHRGNATEASALAFAAVLPIAYLAHRHITFADAARDRFQPVRFVMTTSASFLVAVGGMYVATEMLGRSYLVGIALNWMLIPAMNFLIYMVWVFRPRHPDEDIAPLPSANAGRIMERS